jgi:V-type H+-transporting ATPase 16kDa proteolipid subunit
LIGWIKEDGKSLSTSEHLEYLFNVLLANSFACSPVYAVRLLPLRSPLLIRDESSEQNTQSFFGGMGCCMSVVLSVMGAAYGIAKSGVGVSAVSVLRPDMIVRSTFDPSSPLAYISKNLSTDLLLDMMPPILAGILSIYGLVIGVIISSALKEKSALHTNFMYLSAGLACGLSCLAAGFCIGIVGDAGVRGTAQQPRLFMGMMLMLIFAEALGTFPSCREIPIQRERLTERTLLIPHRSLWTHYWLADDPERDGRGNAMLVRSTEAGNRWSVGGG